MTDPSAAAALSPEQWVALHVPRYAQAFSSYKAYEAFLKDALKELSRPVAPLAVVEARAKGVPSFAEKILRKRDSYVDFKDPLPPDPLARLTDLCGGRVICQTATQVKAVCKLIENAFVIDWPNSEDVSKRLRTAEFGYRSVHYIVQVDAKRLAEAGIKTAVPADLGGFPAALLGDHLAGRPLRAEIQVRTLLEHTSSDLGHDSIYKAELKVPERIKRQYAALAAVLESADREIEQVLSALGDFKSNSGAWLDRKVAEQEIGYAQVLLGLPDVQLPVASKIPVAVRSAQLAIVIGEHEQAVAFLEPFRDTKHAGVQRVLGKALVELHWDNPNGEAFGRGVAHLTAAIALDLADAETLGLLAECAAHQDDDVLAREIFARAMAAESNEPITLVRYLEFEAAAANSDTPLRMAAPMLRAALVRAQRQIEARVNLASAWQAAAMIQLFLGQPFDALHALAQLVRLCMDSSDKQAGAAAVPKRICAAGRALLRLRQAVRRLRGIREKLEGFAWFERFVLVAAAARVHDPKAQREVADLASWKTRKAAGASPHFAAERQVVILSGGCDPDVQARMVEFGKLLGRACQGLVFDLISGGTRVGISGVAGDLATASKGSIGAYGYLPGHPPRGIVEDSGRFTLCIGSPGTDFTPLDPLQAWTDLLAAGVLPTDVKLICYAPGDIARAECAIALALGARVGFVTDSDLAKDRGFDAGAWDGHGGLLLLPLDAMTIRAFVQISNRALSEEDRKRLEPAARQAHEAYVKSATPQDASLAVWDKLSETLKLSNFSQVAYWEQTLRDYGLRLRKLTEDDKRHPPLSMEEALPKRPDGDPILELAELEHGRWNVERLSQGWRYAAEKDVARKLSPWLIPWTSVPKHIQKFDIDAIRELPQKLRLVELELFRL